MPGLQRILVVSTAADEAEVLRLRAGLGRDPLLLVGPTAEAQRVVGVLGLEPEVEVLLAPVRFPQVDRGHLVDELVRRHALQDRFRDVVVVIDPATATLLLRVLAPDQLATGGAVTVVGLARADRPVDLRRACVVGSVLGGAAGLSGSLVALLALPAAAAAAAVGLVLIVLPSRHLPSRHLGRELLLAASIALVVSVAIVAGSARFPGAF